MSLADGVVRGACFSDTPSASLSAMEDTLDVSDEVLLRRYRQGNGGAFEQLYQRHRAPLYRYLLRSCSGEAEAQDLFQEVWSRVIGSDGSFHGDSFLPYLYRIARNLRIDLARRQHLRLVGDDGVVDELASDEADAVRQLHMEDCGRRLRGELGELPEEQREAFLLKEESGLSLEQIAELVATGRETIKSRLRYALKRLRQALEDCL